MKRRTYLPTYLPCAASGRETYLPTYLPISVARAKTYLPTHLLLFTVKGAYLEVSCRTAYVTV